jgi:hypothetical protein
MEDLKTKYFTQMDKYKELAEKGDIPGLRELNASITKTLNSMIEKLTFLQKNTRPVEKERDELLARLRQIQKDSNGLLSNTDRLATLRRIRKEEASEGDGQLNMYLLFFFILTLVIVMYLLFMTHKKDTTAPIASIPPTTAAFV